MGKGRAPCCDKTQVKRGPWSPAEDLRLIGFIQKHGHQNWRALPKQAGLLRCGKSCRLRWINYLRPDVKRGSFTAEEEDTIIRLHEALGNKWSRIASNLPGRTDNEIKNVWNTHLKKRLLGTKGNHEGDKGKETVSSEAASSSSSPSSSSSSLLMKKDSSPSMSSNVTDSSQVDIANLEQLVGGSVPDFTGIQEVMSQPENRGNLGDEEAVLMEPDYEFWNLLYCFDSNQNNELDAPNVDDIGDAFLGQLDNKNWLSYLENQLGLDETKDNYANQPQTLFVDNAEVLPFTGTADYDSWSSL